MPPHPAFVRLLLCVAAASLIAGCDPAVKSRPGGTATTDSSQPPMPEIPSTPAGPVIPEVVTFNEHIQPILSEYCYHCHGPDEKTRFPEDKPLRIDRPEFAFEPRENGKPVIIKGNAAESLVMKLIHSDDQETIMPPPESHKTLDATQIALLEKWINDGAEYQEHWAFIPVSRPEVPPNDNKGWQRPIDAFVHAKLKEHHLEPAPADDLARYHRRLTLDTTGLPPSPAETQAFLDAAAKDTEAAISAEADRLLATPASAEHFARHWLDAARYADTHGIHIDNYRAIWPYRDWVIRAFQQNMPWDQFTIEQIAGDLLPEPSLDQVVATGFNRCLPTTGEGGAIADEYLAIYAKDRVETTSAVWLGLTAGCAACHDHKFDPVSMREFYSLAAFFRNTPMSALDGNNANHPPSIFVPIPEDRSRFTAIDGEIASKRQEIEQRRKTARRDFEAWLTSASIPAPAGIENGLHLHLPLTDVPGPMRGTVDAQAREWTSDAPRIDGPLGPAPVISHQPVELGDLASFPRKAQVSYGGFIRIEGTPTGAVIARMNPAEKFRGWDLYIQNGRIAAHVIESFSESAAKIVATHPLAPGQWHHVMVTFDGGKRPNETLRIFVNGSPAETKMEYAKVGQSIETQVPLRLGSRHGDDSRLNGPTALQDFRFYRRLLTPGEIQALALDSILQHVAKLPPDQRREEQLNALFDYYITHADAPAKTLREQIAALEKEQNEIRARGSMSLVMEEKPTEPFANILNRGVYSDVGERVTPTTPAVLPPMPADAPRNRLGLARWLVDPANPLPARVTMNRTWYYFFGTGLVETTEDFGIMGARPSHPALLDWLAAEFVDSGWNYRHMVKLIVTSATYRQSGQVTPAKLDLDPLNRLLSRGPRYRLDAEQIRDLALEASGLLARRMGGPPVKPYQPEGIWEAVAMPQSNTRFYKQDSGESLYRRSIYTFWKRTAPNPTMEILNAPSREVFCVRRERTNTPLQALATLNDPQFVEACRNLAEQAVKSAPDPSARLDFITLRLVSRTMNAEERSVVLETLAEAMKAYSEQPEAAAKLIATGETKADATVPPAELASWTLVASQILNLDETLTK